MNDDINRTTIAEALEKLNCPEWAAYPMLHACREMKLVPQKTELVMDDRFAVSGEGYGKRTVVLVNMVDGVTAWAGQSYDAVNWSHMPDVPAIITYLNEAIKKVPHNDTHP